MKYIKSILTTYLILTIISHMAYGDCPDEIHAAIDASTTAACDNDQSIAIKSIF